MSRARFVGAAGDRAIARSLTRVLSHPIVGERIGTVREITDPISVQEPAMQIGIIGSGNIGGAVAALMVEAGHDVALSHASGPASLRDQVAALGPRARAATIDEAADFGDVVFLAIPWRSRADLPARRLRGKIVVDAMNPYRPDFGLYDLGDSTSSEEVAKALPGARIVKAFNSLHAKDLATRGRPVRPTDERTALPIASNDQDAKRVIIRLVDELGFAPVDTGSLRDGGRIQQPGGPLFGRVVSRADAQVAVRRGEDARAGNARTTAQHP